MHLTADHALVLLWGRNLQCGTIQKFTYILLEINFHVCVCILPYWRWDLQHCSMNLAAADDALVSFQAVLPAWEWG